MSIMLLVPLPSIADLRTCAVFVRVLASLFDVVPIQGLAVSVATTAPASATTTLLIALPEGDPHGLVLPPA